MSLKTSLYLVFVIIVIAGACSVVKKEDPEKKVRAFLFSFQTSLSGADQQILKHFHVRQSPDAILSVIRILQNSEKYVKCTAKFSEADVAIVEKDILVTIPATFTVTGLDDATSESTILQFWLQPEGKTYSITQLKGEVFFSKFTSLKNRNQWEFEQEEAVAFRLPIYAKAKELEAKFDTVIFYATYNHLNYFYVAEGDWTNYFLDNRTSHLENTDIKMGLADSDGNIIIPLEYDLIGTIGFEKPDLVEVTKDGKFGYFDLATKSLVIQPLYDIIIPVASDSTFAVVRQDTTFGWFTADYKFRQGFPSKKVGDWVQNFSYLKKNLRLASELQSLCEIPLQDYLGSGIAMPPSYLVKAGIFEEMEDGIATTPVPLNAYTEYKETEGSMLQRISHGFNAFVTLIRTRYLDGREEFYDRNQIVFFNDRLDTLGTAQINSREFSIRAIDSTLLEAKTNHDFWFLEEDVCEETNLYKYTYFSFDQDGSFKELKSNRLFPETQFVKLDNSYITGNFLVYNREREAEEPTTKLSLKTLISMKNEILADNGYIFHGADTTDQYHARAQRYTQRYEDIADVMEQLSDIDRHNVKFLEDAINSLQKEDEVDAAETNI